MSSESFIDPLFNLLNSGKYIITRCENSVYCIRYDDGNKISKFRAYYDYPYILWHINMIDNTASKIYNFKVMKSREYTKEYNKWGKSKSKKLYPEQYDYIYAFICKYLINKKLKEINE